MSGLIYYITSKATGRVYVGSTTRSAKQRWAEHMRAMAAQGKSFREIERLTGRCRRVIARACKEAV